MENNTFELNNIFNSPTALQKWENQCTFFWNLFYSFLILCGNNLNIQTLNTQAYNILENKYLSFINNNEDKISIDNNINIFNALLKQQKFELNGVLYEMPQNFCGFDIDENDNSLTINFQYFALADIESIEPIESTESTEPTESTDKVKIIEGIYQEDQCYYISYTTESSGEIDSIVSNGVGVNNWLYGILINYLSKDSQNFIEGTEQKGIVKPEDSTEKFFQDISFIKINLTEQSDEIKNDEYISSWIVSHEDFGDYNIYIKKNNKLTIHEIQNKNFHFYFDFNKFTKQESTEQESDE